MASFSDVLKRKLNENKTTYSAIAAVTAVVGTFYLGRYIQKRKQEQQLKDFEDKSKAENKIILHMSPQWDFATPHASPYVTKLLTFFAYHKIPYIIDETFPMHFYTQKMPWITYKNCHQPDSNLVIEWFKTQSDYGNIDMDKHLNEKELAICTAFKSMIEDGLAWVLGYRRWYIPHNLRKYSEMLFQDAPWKGKIIVKLFKGKIRKAFWLCGIARFKEEEVFQKGENLIESVVKYMSDNKFFFGDKLSTLDISIYGHIGGMYQLCSVMTWGGKKQLPAKMPYMKEINEYMKRIEIECFGELKYWKDIV